MNLPSVRRDDPYSRQLVIGAVLGALQGLSLAPRRPWRFLVIAVAVGSVPAIFDFFRRRYRPESDGGRLAWSIVAMALAWGIVGFVVTSLRIVSH